MRLFKRPKTNGTHVVVPPEPKKQSDDAETDDRIKTLLSVLDDGITTAKNAKESIRKFAKKMDLPLEVHGTSK